MMNTKEIPSLERRSAIPLIEVGRKIEKFGKADGNIRSLVIALSNPIDNKNMLQAYPGKVGKIAQDLPDSSAEPYSPSELSALAETTKLRDASRKARGKLERQAHVLMHAPELLELAHEDIVSQNPNIPLDRTAQFKARTERINNRLQQLTNHIHTEDGAALMTRQSRSVDDAQTSDAERQIADKLAHLNPNNPVYLNFKGNVARNSGDTEEAVTYYNAAMKGDSEYSSPHNNLANIYREQENPQAINHAYRALELNPETPHAFMNLAMLYEDQGNHEKAVEFYTRALELSPESYFAHNNLGALNIKLGNLEEASRLLTRALELNPNSPLAHDNVSNLYVKQDNLEGAKKHLNRALELDPENVDSLYNLALLYTTQGNPEAALALYKRALVLAPGDKDIQQAIADLEPQNIPVKKSLFKKLLG